MKLLLDTHIWLWSLLEPRRLSRPVERALRSTRNELWLSPISVWEALMLIEAKRIRVRGNGRAWIERVLAEVPLTEAPVTHAVSLESRQVGLEHADPGDRFIAATAKVHELVLVTADQRLLDGKGFRTFKS